MKNSIKLIMFAGVSFFVFSCTSKDGHETGGKAATLSNVKVVNEVDPVCEMSTSKHLKDTLTYEGKLYGFCSSNCKEKFEKDPQSFLKGK